MTIDLSNPEAFAVSGAAIMWFVIEKIIKPVATDNWRWFQARTESFRYGFWTLLVLAVLTPCAWYLFKDWTTVLPAVIAAVVGSQWTHSVVRAAGVGRAGGEELERLAARAGVAVGELGEL
ncbi:MAG: hypothetical protein QM328_02885 [Acidobacteriota bacterium]|nr:hypothetical protein [Acidobacteriota bacterium]